MNPLDEKFLNSKQEKQRLFIALSRYFVLREEMTEESQIFVQYRDYLKLRFRPAAQELIKEKEILKLQTLFEDFGTDRLRTEECLLLAQKDGDGEMTQWLLAYKASHFGFAGKQYEL